MCGTLGSPAARNGLVEEADDAFERNVASLGPQSETYASDVRRGAAPLSRDGRARSEPFRGAAL